MRMSISARFETLVVFVACILFLISGTVFAAPADHVVLVSVDGFRPDFYLDANWPAPTIQMMAEEGVRAERVRGVFPTVTYPSHTTMITGVHPAKHGIVYNNPFEPGGQTGVWYWEASAIKVPTIWGVLRDAGKKTAAVSWPVTVGAPIDWVLPEVWALSGEDRLAPTRKSTLPAGLWEELEREATGKLDMKTYSVDYIGRDIKIGSAAAYLLQTKKPALVALHLVGTDHFQHDTGRDSAIVRRALGAADSQIGAMIEAAQRAEILDRTAFIITGDHGFVNTQTSLAPNVWLEQAGVKTGGADWRARFHTQGGAAFLFLRDANDTATLDQVRAIVEQLPERIRRMFRMVEGAELNESGADPASPLALAAGMSVLFIAAAVGNDIGPAIGGTHGYFPTDFPEIYTGFVGWGAGFRKGVTVHDMGLEDVAAVISRLLDVPFEGIDGVAPAGIFAP